MAYTRHGHHIPGTLKGEGVTTAPSSVARCGAFILCEKCKKDAEEYRKMKAETPEGHQQKARELVRRYIDARNLANGIPYELFVPWFCKLLKGWKATVGTTLPDGYYFELTHNGEKNETYLDFYQKRDNLRIPDERHL